MKAGWRHLWTALPLSPQDMPYYRSQFKKCAVVGNGGILKNSRCGREINKATLSSGRNHLGSAPATSTPTPLLLHAHPFWCPTL